MLIRKGSRGDAVKKVQKMLHLYEDGIFGKLTEEAVKEFQKENGLTVDGIVGDNTFAKMLGIEGVTRKRRIDEIIVHCSATAEGKDYTVEDITRWHKQRGFSTIGYHYVIYRNGTIYTGRNIDVAGAHCTGHNTHSIGVCYIGGCKADGQSPKDTRTPEQKQALRRLLSGLKELYPKARIFGHKTFCNKACPCFSPEKEYNDL